MQAFPSFPILSARGAGALKVAMDLQSGTTRLKNPGSLIESENVFPFWKFCCSLHLSNESVESSDLLVC